MKLQEMRDMEIFGGKADSVILRDRLEQSCDAQDVSFNRKRRRQALKHFQSFIEDHKPSKLA